MTGTPEGTEWLVMVKRADERWEDVWHVRIRGRRRRTTVLVEAEKRGRVAPGQTVRMLDRRSAEQWEAGGDNGQIEEL